MSIWRVLVIPVFVAVTALAVSTGRAAYPLVVDDAGVHPPGESEWVLSADALRTPAVELLAANFSVAVGMLPRLEGSLGFGYGWMRDRSPGEAPTRDGVLDVTLGIKAPIWLEETAPFAFTLSAAAKLPTASARLGLGTEFADLSLLAIATRSWGALSFDLNGGFTWTAVGRRAERAGDGWFVGAALRWPASERLLLFAETYAALPCDGVTEPTGTVRGGWQLALRPSVLLGGAIGTGCGRGAAEMMATVGLTLIY
jgi:hypothetical protein